MIPWAYYNEHDAETAAWLQNNIDAGLIAPGVVDTRSITEVSGDDLGGFTQCHFFAGIGGWSFAARLAGWPDERPLWSGSCPCQPFSAAGKGGGADDPRHLWPDFHRLVRAARPAVVVGEQVAGAAGYGWFDGVRADLAREGFASRVVDIPALAIDAPHQRNRLYWCALADGAGQPGICREAQGERARHGEPERSYGVHGGGSLGDPEGGSGAGFCENGSLLNRAEPANADGSGVALGDAARLGRGEGRAEYELRRGWDAAADADGESDMGHAGCEPGKRNAGSLSRAQEASGGARVDNGRLADRHRNADGRNGSWWAGADWILCHDQKARRVADARAPLLVDGFPNRILAWRGLGNAIVAPLAAEVLGALMDVME